jgi:DNA-binding MurR/RpiR family transcriptional regulator
VAFFGYKDIDKLSGVDLAIYRFIVEHDEQIPYMRVRELARGAHVSNSSVMRFIRKIGYDSFPEFKYRYAVKRPFKSRMLQVFSLFNRVPFLQILLRLFDWQLS